MSLAKKYGLSEEVVKSMIRDGILPCSIVKAEEVIAFYDKEIRSGVPKSEAVKRASDELNVSIRSVYRFIKIY